MGREGELPRQPLQGVKYYCPKCGEVQWAIRGYNFLWQKHGWYVLPHYRHHLSLDWSYEECPGGPVTAEDKAP